MAILIGVLLLVQAPMMGGAVTPVVLRVDGLGFVLLAQAREAVPSTDRASG